MPHPARSPPSEHFRSSLLCMVSLLYVAALSLVDDRGYLHHCCLFLLCCCIFVTDIRLRCTCSHTPVYCQNLHLFATLQIWPCQPQPVANQGTGWYVSCASISVCWENLDQKCKTHGNFEYAVLCMQSTKAQHAQSTKAQQIEPTSVLVRMQNHRVWVTYWWERTVQTPWSDTKKRRDYTFQHQSQWEDK